MSHNGPEIKLADSSRSRAGIKSCPQDLHVFIPLLLAGAWRRFARRNFCNSVTNNSKNKNDNVNLSGIGSEVLIGRWRSYIV